MQIIVVSDHSAKTRTVTLGPLQLASGAVALLLGALVIAGLLFVLTMRHATELRLPLHGGVASGCPVMVARRRGWNSRDRRGRNISLLRSESRSIAAQLSRAVPPGPSRDGI